MLKRLDRIRFRGQRRDELAESPNTSDTEETEDTGDTEELSPAVSQDEPRTDLNEVQELLEIALLEKHFLHEELRKLKQESNVDLLEQELEKERSMRLQLEQKINDILKSSHDDSACQTPKAPPPDTPAGSSADKQQDTLYSRVLTFLYKHVGVYIEDFRFQPEETPVETEEPLSARRLTENMRRLKRGYRPVRHFLQNLSALSSWYSAYTSAVVFIVYMYAAWHGWAIPMFLFLAILRLSLNYLIARGWRIQWSIVPELVESVEPPKEDRTMSEKFQLVLVVAQKAQNIFGRMADVLEKIKNLLMWVQPELTQKLYAGLWVAFIASCLLPYDLLGFIIAVFAGIKFFIITFIFKSCPKLRQRFDTPYIIWTNLPTDLQVKERDSITLNRRVPVGVSRDEDGGRYYSTKRGAFHEVFNLPESERPLTTCENGWRCCLINRDRKTLAEYIRNGVLYITENYLCFESSSSRSGSSKRNRVFKLLDIKEIQKHKVLSVLPGSGMGISIAISSTLKPLVFGAMIHRDEAFEAISNQHNKILAVATDTNPETE
nr:GRAM domain-containing protein 4-like isoform X1 [Solea senegalensis]XP_043892163.1 GRAM domain-containing protein 4-like isoform X1 [Solea senegalensis]